MKTLKEVAILIKKEFNKKARTPIDKHSGLCAVCEHLFDKKLITYKESVLFTDVMEKELFWRGKGYITNVNNNNKLRKINTNNYRIAYIWFPYDKMGRNRYLNKLINS